MSHKLFISYHLADNRAVQRMKEKIQSKGYEVFSVPENAKFDGVSHESISQKILHHMSDCDVVVVVIGNETYQRPHVDREIHAALSGGPRVRKGIIAVLLEGREDSIRAMDPSSIPALLVRNRDYVIFVQNGSFIPKLDDLIEEAVSRRDDQRYPTDSTSTMRLRSGKYYSVN